MKTSDKKSILKFSLALAEEAGQLLQSYSRKQYSKSLRVLDKGSQGLTSEADLKAEALVIKRIRQEYPEHLIIAEEDSFTRKVRLTGYRSHPQPIWLIDPLDGTNNFLSGLPFYCVSLALVIEGKSQMGVVHNPLLGETFYAYRGGGAFLRRRFGNKWVTRRLWDQAKSRPLKDALISTNLGSKRHNAHLIRRFPEVRAFRRLGSAALELCYVGGGMLDAYWEYHLKPWDIAAGGLVCEEAGIHISDLKGREFCPFESGVLAARSPLYEDLLKILQTP